MLSSSPPFTSLSFVRRLGLSTPHAANAPTNTKPHPSKTETIQRATCLGGSSVSWPGPGLMPSYDQCSLARGVRVTKQRASTRPKKLRVTKKKGGGWGIKKGGDELTKREPGSKPNGLYGLRNTLEGASYQLEGTDSLVTKEITRVTKIKGYELLYIP